MTRLRPIARGTWRLAQPLLGIRGRIAPRLPGAYVRFWREWRAFRQLGGEAPWAELHPAFFDADPLTQSGGGQYFYQDIWALRRVAQLGPDVHHDVGSRLDGFVGQVTSVCPVVFWDIRPPRISLPGFEHRTGSVLELPIPDRSVASLSCLHTAEHVGLGRYGDPLDPDGTTKALRELERVLAPGGQLLFSMPVGRERVCFNAQRVWAPGRPAEVMAGLRLAEFAAVTDDGRFATEVAPDDLADAASACGLYRFTRPEDSAP